MNRREEKTEGRCSTHSKPSLTRKGLHGLGVFSTLVWVLNLVRWSLGPVSETDFVWVPVGYRGYISLTIYVYLQQLTVVLNPQQTMVSFR